MKLSFLLRKRYLLLFALLAMLIHTQAPRLLNRLSISSTESRDLVHLDELQEPLDVEVVKADEVSLRFRTSLGFCATDKGALQNLFQTDDLNEGVRVELNGKSLAVIAASSADQVPLVLVLSDSVESNQCYILSMSVIDRGPLIASLNHQEFSIPKVSAPLKRVRIGVGFDDTRPFLGRLESVRVSVDKLADVRLLRWTLRAFELMFITLVFAGASVRLAVCLRYMASSRLVPDLRWLYNFTIVASVVPFVMASLYLLMRDLASKALANVIQDLMPGVLKTAPNFKIELIGYVLITAAAALAVILLMLTPVVKRLFRGTAYSVSRAYGLMVAAGALAFFSTSMFAKACGVAMGGVILFAFFSKSLLGSRVLTFTVAAFRLTRHRLNNGAIGFTVRLRFVFLVYTASLFVVLYASMQLFSAWWPVQIPPEYYEAPVVIETIHGPQTHLTTDLLKCAASGSNAEECDGLAALKDTIVTQYNWEVETGRLFFHHAYILIPIKAFLAYGFESQVPFLYGFGNSLLSIALTEGDLSISTYLNSIPFVVILSIFVISVCVAFCASNAIVLPIALLLGFTMYFKIEFTPAYLAASFNPSRYLGIALQFVSIFIAARGSPSRILILPATLAFSLMWNTEAAIIGVVAQILILFSLQIKTSLKQRVSTMLSLMLILFVGQTLTFAPSDMLRAIQLGFFNVVVPSLNAFGTLKLYGYLLVGLGILGTLALLFIGRERDARLALIPSLAGLFVKYVFNPASPHLFAVLVFAVPFALLYIPRDALDWRMRRGSLIVSSCIVFFGSVTIQSGMIFVEESKNFKTSATRNYATQQWRELGENFDIPQPEKDFLLRIRSLKAQLSPDVSLLLLSPFDHLLNVYLPPKNYCGHFEMFSNFVLWSHASTVEKCLAANQNLVVYDLALDVECPADVQKLTGADQRCTRFEMKKNLKLLFERLKPNLVKVGEGGGLVFYRYHKYSSPN